MSEVVYQSDGPVRLRLERTPVEAVGELDHDVVGADRCSDQVQVVEADGGVQVSCRGQGVGVVVQVCEAGQPPAYLGPGDVGLSGAQGQGVLHGEHRPGEVADAGQARCPAGGGVEDAGVG